MLRFIIATVLSSLAIGIADSRRRRRLGSIRRYRNKSMPLIAHILRRRFQHGQQRVIRIQFGHRRHLQCHMTSLRNARDTDVNHRSADRHATRFERVILPRIDWSSQTTADESLGLHAIGRSADARRDRRALLLHPGHRIISQLLPHSRCHPSRSPSGDPIRTRDPR